MLLAMHCPADAQQLPSQREDSNTGEDLTSPISRIELRYRFKTREQSSDVSVPNIDTHVLELRAEKTISLDESSQVSLRLDVPVNYTDAASVTNPAGTYAFGLSDLLTQVQFGQALTERWAVGGGSRLIFPTASQPQMGTGRYRLVPLAGARYSLPELGAGSFATGIVRYDFDFAGEAGRRHISELQLDPMLTVNLAERWFVTLYPSADIRINLAHERSFDTGRLFLPLDAMVGKKFGNDFIASVEIAFPIVNDYRVYDFKLESRIGFFF